MSTKDGPKDRRYDPEYLKFSFLTGAVISQIDRFLGDWIYTPQMFEHPWDLTPELVAGWMADALKRGVPPFLLVPPPDAVALTHNKEWLEQAIAAQRQRDGEIEMGKATVEPITSLVNGYVVENSKLKAERNPTTWNHPPKPILNIIKEGYYIKIGVENAINDLPGERFWCLVQSRMGPQFLAKIDNLLHHTRHHNLRDGDLLLVYVDNVFGVLDPEKNSIWEAWRDPNRTSGQVWRN